MNTSVGHCQMLLKLNDTNRQGYSRRNFSWDTLSARHSWVIDMLLELSREHMDFNISSFPLQVQSLKLLSTLTWLQRSWNWAWCKELPFRWLSKVIGGSILGWEILSDFCPQGSPIDYGRAPMGRLCVCDAIISNDILSVLCLQPLFKTFTSNNPTWML